jgi:hypothetical protein
MVKTQDVEYKSSLHGTKWCFYVAELSMEWRTQRTVMRYVYTNRTIYTSNTKVKSLPSIVKTTPKALAQFIPSILRQENRLQHIYVVLLSNAWVELKVIRSSGFPTYFPMALYELGLSRISNSSLLNINSIDFIISQPESHSTAYLGTMFN